MWTNSVLNAGRTASNFLGYLLLKLRVLAVLFIKVLFTGVLFIEVLICQSALGDTLMANTLSIAAASNFRPMLEQLSQAFSEQQNTDGVRHQINISSASSGVIYAQILQGAPFQLFFSANESYPEKLVASGHGDAGTLAIYAIGKLILVSRHDATRSNEVSQKEAVPKDLLLNAKRIAIANPRTAPYGIAAMDVMENLGVANKIKSKLVVGNNIAQAWQFFHSGNADVAIVAASLVSSTNNTAVKEQQERMFTIDLSSYLKHPVRQGRVAVKPISPLTQQFLDFMNTPIAEKIMTDGGYLLPIKGKNIIP
jgi:molybdate transport system substrate-binding protein